MTIAICDDNRQDVAALREILIRRSISIVIDAYASAEDFLAAVKSRRYDMVFMDIYAGKESRLDVIRSMKEISPKTAVVFTAGSDAHAVEAFGVNAIHYLVKPVSEAGVAEALQRYEALQTSDPPGCSLTIRIGNDIYTLDQREIVRVEASDHKTNLYMRNGTVYSIWMPFHRVTSQLDPTFLPVSRGVTVNMRHIVKWRSQDCETVDGMRYLLSRARRQQLKEAYLAYKADEMSAWLQ